MDEVETLTNLLKNAVFSTNIDLQFLFRSVLFKYKVLAVLWYLFDTKKSRIASLYIPLGRL